MAPDGEAHDNMHNLPKGSVSGRDSDDLFAETRAASDFMKALGHEGRLLMLYHLCERDMTVTELEQMIQSRQAAVSQQLARLRHEKIVSARRDGNQIIYSLADERVRAMVVLLQRLFRG